MNHVKSISLQDIKNANAQILEPITLSAYLKSEEGGSQFQRNEYLLRGYF